MFAVRGGSRVVRVTFTNHSNVFKPAFVISQVLYYSARNQLSFLFYCLLLNKQGKKHCTSLLCRSHSKPSPSRANWQVSVRAVSSFVDTPENNAKNYVGTIGESLYPVGETGWYMDLVTNHSKPTLIGQKHSHCLVNYSNL